MNEQTESEQIDENTEVMHGSRLLSRGGFIRFRYGVFVRGDRREPSHCI